MASAQASGLDDHEPRLPRLVWGMSPELPDGHWLDVSALAMSHQKVLDGFPESVRRLDMAFEGRESA